MKTKIFFSVCFSVLISLSAISSTFLGDAFLQLFDFNVVQNGTKMDIKWSVRTESKGEYFTIEKSRDGKNFTKLIDLPASESSPVYAEYFETDYQPYNGVSYYRIKQTDQAGNEIYSHVVTVKFEEQNLQYSGTGYENPSLTIAIKNFQGRETLLVLRDSDGNDYCLKTTVEQENNRVFAINAYPYPSIGTYHVVGSTNDKLFNQQVIVK